MLLIVACHYVSWIPQISFLGQVFNVGVPLFFIISGFLYGQKEITNPLAWFKKQFVKISVPVYLYYIIFTIVLLCIGKLGIVSPISTIKQILHLKGALGGGIGEVQTGHLWFITFLLMCYLITPLLQKIDVSNKIWIAVAGGGITLELICMLAFGNYAFWLWMPGVFSYVAAYFMGRRRNKTVSNKTMLFLSFLMVAFLAIRMLAKLFIDESRLYDNVIFEYSQCVLAFWIFFFIFWIYPRVKAVRSIAPIAKCCNRYSFEVYIVHNAFLSGVLSFQFLTKSLVLNSLAFAASTIVVSVGLFWASDRLKRLL
jgi:surface polysaccharide O-acyltransferase-like enzyme